MMPTQDEGTTLVLDEPIPEVDAELEEGAAIEPERAEEFLLAVRELVHGQQASAEDAPREATESLDAGSEQVVAEEDLSDWLPGIWVTEGAPPRRRARADRRATRSSRRRQEKAARHEAAPPETQRVPAQSGAPTTEELAGTDVETAAELGEVAASRRARRRERRRQETQELAASAAEPSAELEPVETGSSTAAGPGRAPRGSRRRQRRREAAHALARAVPAVEAPISAGQSGPDASSGSGSGGERPRQHRAKAHVAEVPADLIDVEQPFDAVLEAEPSRRARRRERRREEALATQIAQAVVAGVTPPEEVRVEAESLEEYLARVEASRLPRRSRRSRPRTPPWLRQTAKVSLVSALIVACAVLPWVAPQVPGMFADLVPEQKPPVTRVEDPPVAPSTEAFTGPVGIKEQAGPLAGVRLKAAGWPREVRIPRLSVDSDVIPISGQSGTLLPPDDPQELGWWREGKPVGAQHGTAVITGHSVHTGGGALDNLAKLVVGDSLRVRTDDGWIRYVVQRTQVYSKGKLALDAEKLFRLGGPGRLVVVSCDDWNGEFYESNAVVVATPVADQPFDS